jgi:hypothetical protein
MPAPYPSQSSAFVIGVPEYHRRLMESPSADLSVTSLGLKAGLKAGLPTLRKGLTEVLKRVPVPIFWWIGLDCTQEDEEGTLCLDTTSKR